MWDVLKSMARVNYTFAYEEKLIWLIPEIHSKHRVSIHNSVTGFGNGWSVWPTSVRQFDFG